MALWAIVMHVVCIAAVISIAPMIDRMAVIMVKGIVVHKMILAIPAVTIHMIAMVRAILFPAVAAIFLIRMISLVAVMHMLRLTGLGPAASHHCIRVHGKPDYSHPQDDEHYYCLLHFFLLFHVWLPILMAIV
jgi:hypothetical protein